MTSDPALEPGADYYFVVTQKHCTTVMGQPAPTEVVLTGETDDTPYVPDGGVGSDATVDATPDGGTDDGPKNKGCGCVATTPEGPTAPFAHFLLGLLVLGVIRRRR
jgi:MYXO-CTERM domain-containing protein